MTYILSLATGMITGVVFGLVKLPIPAPDDIRGILGIAGIFIGYMLIQKIRTTF